MASKKNHAMKKLFYKLALVWIFAVSNTAAFAEQLVVPFADGLFGDDDGNNTIDSLNIQSFSSLGLDASFFSQVSSGGIFEDDSQNTLDPTTCVGGNDIPGRLRIRAAAYATEIPGCLDGKYKERGRLIAFNFNPTASGAISYTKSDGSTGTVSISDNSLSSLNIAVVLNGHTIADLTPTNSSDDGDGILENGEDISGDSSGVLADLNAYLTLAVRNSPSGPITASNFTYVLANNPTNMPISGTVTLQAGETVTVFVNGGMYTSTGGQVTLTSTGAANEYTWSITLANQPAGTYDVDAWIVNNGNWILQDSTNDELRVISSVETSPIVSLRKTTSTITSLSDGADAGDVISYTITASNTGSSLSAYNLSLTDTLIISDGSTSYPRAALLQTSSCTGTLAVGASCTAIYNYTLTTADITDIGNGYTSLKNLATLTYEDAASNGSSYTLESSSVGNSTIGAGNGDTTDLTLVISSPALTVQKTIDTLTSVSGKARILSNSIIDMDGDGALSANDRIYYEIQITNSGNTELTSVSLSDTLTNGDGTALSFPAGGTPTKSSDTGLVTSDTSMDVNDIWIYSAYYEVTSADISSGSLENVAAVTATGAGTTFTVESSTAGNSTAGAGNGSPTTLIFSTLIEEIEDDLKTVLQDDLAATLNQQAAMMKQFSSGALSRLKGNRYSSCGIEIADQIANAPILFESSSATLLGGSDKTLDRIAEILSTCPETTFEVAGHTDNLASEEYNSRLSQARAASVVAALQMRDIPIGQLHSAGYGESHPIADNANPLGRAANRRVEFVPLITDPTIANCNSSPNSSGNFNLDGGEDGLSANGDFQIATQDCSINGWRTFSGNLSVLSNEDGVSQSMVNLTYNVERMHSNETLKGWFMSVYATHDDISGLATGTIEGFGLAGGVYGATQINNSLYGDYYLGASTGKHNFDLNFDRSNGVINADGFYRYYAIFGGAAVSGETTIMNLESTLRAGIDMAWSPGGDAELTASRNSTDALGFLTISSVSGVRVYGELGFNDLMPDDPRILYVAPRFFCEQPLGETQNRCGFGSRVELRFDGDRGKATYKVTFDAEASSSHKRYSAGVNIVKPLFGGTLVTTVGLAQGGSPQSNVTYNLEF